MSKTENRTFSFDPLGYYAILGVAYDASETEIKQNYRERAKLLHPDRIRAKTLWKIFRSCPWPMMC